MKTQSPILRTFFGVVFAGALVLAGAYIVAVSCGVMHGPAANFHAPHFVTTAVGLVFLLGGLMVFAQALSIKFGAQNLLLQWIHYVLVLLAILASSVVFLWAGFGAGAHNLAQAAALDSIRAANALDGDTGQIFIVLGVVVMVFVVLAWGVFKRPTVRAG